MDDLCAKDIRKAAGLSITAAAALAGRSPNTYRLFEANPDAVQPDVRRDCDGAIAKMRQIARSKAAA